MLLRQYGYGALMKRRQRKNIKCHASMGKVARELADGDRVRPDTWPSAFVIDGWPASAPGVEAWPPAASDDGWPPREAAWPGGVGWVVEASPFPPDVETDPFARRRDIDPLSPKGQWLAALDQNFPDWEAWDGVVTVDLNRQ